MATDDHLFDAREDRRSRTVRGTIASMICAPVLDVGGTHVTAAQVDTATWSSVPGSRSRLPLRSDGTADHILRAIAAAIETLGPLRGRTLTIAMPDPFDYEAGIGRFRGVAKFDALNGVNVRQALLDTLAEPPDAIEFLNDAVAFGIGEWVSGAIQGCERALAITLGTGVGSAFIDKGHPVASGDAVPPHGTVHRLEVDGQPLEDLVSRRAIISAYRRYQGDSTASASPASSAASASSAGELDVRHIAERADDGDAAALRALQEPCRILGSALAPWIDRFGAEALVIGGGITASWPLLAPPLREGLGSDVRVVRSRDPEESAEVGAAWHTVSRAGGPSVPRSADLRP